MKRGPSFRPGRLVALLRDRSGNLATMTAMLLPAGLVLAAFAIDAGSLFTERRSVQSVADLAAIAAAANIADAEDAVRQTLIDNGIKTVRFVLPGQSAPLPAAGEAVATIVLGNYTGSAATAPESRFAANATPPNAVQVTIETVGQRYFSSSIIAPPAITAQGVAHLSSVAAFSIGSRLAKVDGGILNGVLGGLLGSTVSLSVMDYEALAKADVTVFDFLDVLATKAHLTGGTYTDVLQSTVTVGQVAEALADVPGLDRRSKAALHALGVGATGSSLKLGSVVGLGQAGYLSLGGRPAGLTVVANALQMLTAAAAIANGDHQVALNLGATIPGLVSATLDLAVGEPPQSSPWFAIGETGQLVRTAQTRALLTVEIGGPGGLLGTSIKLPIYIELAFAEATLSDIACSPSSPSSLRVGVAARPGVADLRIAAVDMATLPRFTSTPKFSDAQIVKAPLVGITGSAHVAIANQAASKLSFSKSEIDKRAIKTVSTRDLTQSLTRTLLGDLSLTVKLAGADLGLSPVLKSTLLSTLTAATPAIDTLLLGVLDALGVSVGQADVRVTGASCGRAVLVQ